MHRCTVSHSSAAAASGGGIANFGELYLFDSTINNNASADDLPVFGEPGGGISNHGALTAMRTGFFNNTGGTGGGAIENPGTLRLETCTFTGNSAYAGGAILNKFGSSMEVIGCTVTNNSAGVVGGGIHNNGGSVTVQNSLFSANEAFDDGETPGSGGAIFNAGMLLVSRSNLLGNSAHNGAGIFNAIPELAATMTLDQTTLAGNSAVSGGAGIFNDGTAILNQTTVAENRVTVVAGGCLGAGIRNPGDLTVNQSTVCGNRFISGSFTGDSGGGIHNSGTLTLSNSIVADNSASLAPDLHNAGVMAFSDANLVQGLSDIGTTTGPPPLAAAPQLAPPGDFGGATLTMPPLPGSPVIDAAPNSTFTIDQRDAPRISGPFPDLGAVEAFPFSSLALLDTDGDGIDDRLEPAYPEMTVGTDDSALDSDGDGSSDAEELGNMTDPSNGNDNFRILTFVPASGFDSGSNPLFDVTYKTFPGLYYALDGSPSLAGFEYIPGSGVIASGVSHQTQVLLDPGRSFVRARRGSPSVRWATSVIGFSSQFDTGPWSAAQALGPPDIYPTYGDISAAWATLSPDEPGEFIELGFEDAAPILPKTSPSEFIQPQINRMDADQSDHDAISESSSDGDHTRPRVSSEAPSPQIARHPPRPRASNLPNRSSPPISPHPTESIASSHGPWNPPVKILPQASFTAWLASMREAKTQT